MNIVDFFKDVVADFNEKKKCNYCWAFGAPLSVSGMNASRPAEKTECCTHLYITKYQTLTGYGYTTFGTVYRKHCDHTFEIYVTRTIGELGINTYSEQPGHDIEESLWEKILRPLQECLGCGNEFDLCSLGYDFEILLWKMEVVQRFEDSNHAGWRITGTFRQKISD